MSITLVTIAAVLAGGWLWNELSESERNSKLEEDRRRRREEGERLAVALSNLRKDLVDSTPWWQNGIPKSTELVIDTCVWMNDSPRVDAWFHILIEHAKEKHWKIVLLKSVYEEISKFRMGEQARKASIAKKRISRFQDACSGNFVMKGELKYTRENQYADEDIMRFMLSDEGGDCILFTLDRELKIRLKQIANQQGRDIQTIRCIDNFFYHEKYVWKEYRLVTESCYPYDASYSSRCVSEGDAIREFLDLAMRGTDPVQLVEAGDSLYNGTKGVEQDFQKAFFCYRKAVKYGGGSWAYYNVGKCYIEGKGVDKNDDEARKWFGKAKAANPENFWAKLKLAELGDAESMSEVGDSYYDGHEEAQGCPRDVGKAMYWYRRSADLGYHWGCFNVGKCYLEGQGVGKDDTEARKWFRKALELHENLWALYWLAEMGDTGAVAQIVEYRNSGRLEQLLSENDIDAFLKKTEKYAPFDGKPQASREGENESHEGDEVELPLEISLEPCMQLQCEVFHDAPQSPKFVFPKIRITNRSQKEYEGARIRIINSKSREYYLQKIITIAKDEAICVDDVGFIDPLPESFEVEISHSCGIKKERFGEGWQEQGLPVAPPIKVYWLNCTWSTDGVNPVIKNMGNSDIWVELYRRQRNAKDNPYKIRAGKKYEFGYSEWRRALEKNEPFWIKTNGITINCVIRP